MGETVSGRIDIHAHVLPGIDDGPETIEASVAMARAAAAAGTAILAATPHLHSSFPNVDIEQIAAGVQHLQAAIDAEGIELRLVPAAETSLVWALAGARAGGSASDGHRGIEWRPVGALADGATALSALVGPARAQWMVRDAPEAIVAGELLPPAPEIERARRGLFGPRR